MPLKHVNNVLTNTDINVSGTILKSKGRKEKENRTVAQPHVHSGANTLFPVLTDQGTRSSFAWAAPLELPQERMPTIFNWPKSSSDGPPKQFTLPQPAFFTITPTLGRKR